MRLALSLSLMFSCACAHLPWFHARALSTAPVAAADARAGSPAAPAIAGAARAPTQPTPAAAAVSQLDTPAKGDASADEADADGDDDGDEPAAEEGESHEVADGAAAGALKYTADLNDAQLEALWRSHPEELGSISLGFADEGRIINAQRFPEGPDWMVVSPERAWATRETIDYVKTAIARVKELHPNAPPLRVNQISSREGGYLRPHKSHQSGRDVDLAFYYPSADPVRARAREKVIDVGLTWELLKALVTRTDVQLILVDRHIQQKLHEYALKAGEDKDWLDAVFRKGKHVLIQHARHHRDHFHVRFFNPRAQELGRRVAPLLAERPEQNLATHRVRSGDTLGAIARRYGSSVKELQKANHLRGTFLRLAQVLKVPLRGPCTHCPVPAPVDVPPRLVPPESAATAQAQRASAPEAATAQASARVTAAPPQATGGGGLLVPAMATPPIVGH